MSNTNWELDGVAEVNIYGGREKEARVLLDPTRLAQRGELLVRLVQRSLAAGGMRRASHDDG